MTEHDLLDPIDAYAQPGQIKLGDTDLEGVLDRIAHLARRSIPGADQVSVTLLRGGGARTAAFTGDLAVRLDESQYQVGHGPCLAAAASGVTFSLPDMTAE